MTPRRRWIEATILALLVVWALLMAVDARREAVRQNFLGRSVLILANPVLRATHSFQDRVSQLFLNQFEGRRLRDRNRELRLELTENKLELAHVRDINAHLRRVGSMEFQTLAEKHRLILAEVIGRDRQSNSSALLISRGGADGVVEGLPVVHGDALVGVVRKVQPRSAYVQLLTDPGSLVACCFERTRESGLARGLGPQRSHIEFLPDIQATSRPVFDAELVTSSLTGTLFPGGLRIGTVTRYEANNSGEIVGVVEPAVDFSSIEEVVVLAPREEKPPAAAVGGE